MKSSDWITYLHNGEPRLGWIVEKDDTGFKYQAFGAWGFFNWNERGKRWAVGDFTHYGGYGCEWYEGHTDEVTKLFIDNGIRTTPTEEHFSRAAEIVKAEAVAE